MITLRFYWQVHGQVHDTMTSINCDRIYRDQAIRQAVKLTSIGKLIKK